jgi:hypothetical protein
MEFLRKKEKENIYVYYIDEIEYRDWKESVREVGVCADIPMKSEVCENMEHEPRTPPQGTHTDCICLWSTTFFSSLCGNIIQNSQVAF